MSLFSIVIPHYQGSIAHRDLQRCIGSLWAQSFRDFEILLYHDGPLLDTAVQMPVPITCTPTRFNDWGHSLRDAGIKAATGDYVFTLNADNLLYRDCLEQIAREIQRPPVLHNEQGQPLDNNNIVIYPILLRGQQRFLNVIPRAADRPDLHMILTGNPPLPSLIDAMQLVMRRELWLAEGGWADKSKDADAVLFPKFAEKYGYRAMNVVLGEHF